MEIKNNNALHSKKKLHSVLTFKMGNNKECINRDYNSVRNMLKIVKNLIEHKKRPEKYNREKNLLLVEENKSNGIKVNSSEQKSERVHVGLKKRTHTKITKKQK